MRTKTLLLSAAALVAGLASSVAQSNVYSVNVVGYVNQPMPTGFRIIANPLDAPTNTLNALLSSAPSGTQLYKWNGSGYTSSTKLGANWIPDLTLVPGEGAFINVTTTFTNTWVGEVLQGDLTNALPAGLSLVGSMVPQAGTPEQLELTPDVPSGTQIFFFNGTIYESSTKLGAAFLPTRTINVAQGFFINVPSASEWTRTFNVE
ncbi:MAG TPA: hypothetical protein PLH97_00315 [Verrucomicrobiota bacterium]|nr:hypothetical protein [Verrucomicrobiota bacterium]HPU54713.1 hypothetical protein [Verrucomicrobiota bacterium]